MNSTGTGVAAALTVCTASCWPHLVNPKGPNPQLHRPPQPGAGHRRVSGGPGTPPLALTQLLHLLRLLRLNPGP